MGMLATMEVSVKSVKTRIGYEVPRADETNGDLYICLNYLEELFGWHSCGKTSADVYGVLLGQGFGNHIYLNEAVEYYVNSFKADVPQIWADLTAFEFLVENCDTPDVFIPFGSYLVQNKGILIKELIEGMTPGWFPDTEETA